jgi:hypothetical protein
MHEEASRLRYEEAEWKHFLLKWLMSWHLCLQDTKIDFVESAEPSPSLPPSTPAAPSPNHELSGPVKAATLAKQVLVQPGKEAAANDEEGGVDAVLTPQGMDNGGLEGTTTGTKEPAMDTQATETCKEESEKLPADNPLAEDSTDEQTASNTKELKPERVQQPTTPLLEEELPPIQTTRADDARNKDTQEVKSKQKPDSDVDLNGKPTGMHDLDGIRRAAQEAALAAVAAPSASSTTAQQLASADSTASTSASASGPVSDTSASSFMLAHALLCFACPCCETSLCCCVCLVVTQRFVVVCLVL